MSKKGRFIRGGLVASLREIKEGSKKYAVALSEILSKFNNPDSKVDPAVVVKEMIYLGYAMGGIAGVISDIGIEGYTLLLQGIDLSMRGEDRKEKMLYAIWDKNGDLHTSEEECKIEKGGES